MSNENNGIAVLNEGALSAVASTLEMLKASGNVQISDLFPGLAPRLSDEKHGGKPGMIFLGAVQRYSADQTLPGQDGEEGDVVDVAQLQDVTTDYQGAVFNFYAGNGGLKAKLRNVKDSKFLCIMFKGWAPTGQSGIKSHYKDYLILGGNSKDEMVAAYKALKDAVKAPAKK